MWFHLPCIWRVGIRVRCRVLIMPTVLVKTSIRARRVRMRRRLARWLERRWFVSDEFRYVMDILFLFRTSSPRSRALLDQAVIFLPSCSCAYIVILSHSHSLQYSIYDTTIANRVPRRLSCYTICTLYMSSLVLLRPVLFAY